jgi:hypothetical protein
VEPTEDGFQSGKYQRGADVADSARAAFVGGPSDEEFRVIDVVVPIIGARRTAHLTANLAGLEVTLGASQLGRLDAASAPTLNYPAGCNGDLRATLQFAGATVDGEASGVHPPLLQSDVRY